MTDSRLPSSRATIGAWTVERYQRILAPYLILTPVFFLATLFKLSNLLLVSAEIVAFIIVGMIAVRRRAGRSEVLVIGVVSGILIGVAVSLGRWFADPSVTWGVNVVAETLVTGIVGALLATVGSILFGRKIKPI